MCMRTITIIYWCVWDLYWIICYSMLSFLSFPFRASLKVFKMHIPQADIFPFRLRVKDFKMCMVGRGFNTFIKNVGSHNPLLFGAQRPQWHSFPSLIDVGSHNPPPFGAQCPRWRSFLSPINVGSHNQPPFRAQRPH